MNNAPHETNAAHDLIQIALIHHQSGQLHEAEAIYRQVLANDPANFDALHLLGVIANQSGKSEQAAGLISQEHWVSVAGLPDIEVLNAPWMGVLVIPLRVTAWLHA